MIGNKRIFFFLTSSVKTVSTVNIYFILYVVLQMELACTESLKIILSRLTVISIKKKNLTSWLEIEQFFTLLINIYCMLVREIWNFIHPRVSYSPRRIWYSWVNNFSYFLYPHTINVLLYRMKPRKHIYVKYCWQTYSKSIGTLSRTFKNHIVTVACK